MIRSVGQSQVLDFLASLSPSAATVVHRGMHVLSFAVR